MKRDPRDDLFSKLVRARAEWRCEACGKQYEPSSQGLHCSHLWGRRRRSTRWHPLAAVAHCYSCHQRLGENPIQFAAWIKTFLGVEVAREMHLRAGWIVKWSKADLQVIRDELREEWKRVSKLRGEGVTGRLNFAVPFVENA